jgi:AAHS family 4-hydroxybenzoate transporter-like MFS transporter
MNGPRQATATVNLTELLENSAIGPLQIRVFLLCMLCLIMDGFDVQAMGYAAPAVLRDFGVGGPALGPVFAAANVGVLFGSFIFSMLADKVGRRPVLIGSTLWFSALTIATGFAQSVDQLLWLRLIAGLGLGCIIPNATALVGEFSPKRSRVTLTMGITVGFTAGAAIGGFVALWLIPLWGWRSIFWVGGSVPLVIALAMMWGLPESLQFLAVRRTRLDLLAHWLKKLDPTMQVGPSTEYVSNEKARAGVPLVHLFREGRSTVTILLWIVYFMNLLNLYSLANWIPTVFTGMGYSQNAALLAGTLLQVGGTIGTYGLAWAIARKGFVPVLVVTFVLAAISIAFIGQPGLSFAAVAAIVFIAGWCIVGGQPGLNTLAASYYPTALRSTGVGAGLGFGRLGAIIGPYAGGVLLAQQWAPQQLFWVAAVPAAISAAVMIVLLGVVGGDMGRRASSTSGGGRAPAPEPAPLAH